MRMDKVQLLPVRVDNGSFDNCGIQNIIASQTQFDCSNLGQNSVTLLVKDINQNNATCTAIVTVLDTIAPTIVCAPTFVTYTNIGCTFAGAITAPTISDNCLIDTIYNDAPASYQSDSTLVTWTVRDNSGNISTCTQLVVVIDTVAPVITCPSDLILGPNFGCSYLGNIGQPTITDNCSVVNVTNDAPFVFPSGITVVTWTATDAFGNTSTCTQTIEIIDLIPPTIICPPTANLYANANCNYVGSIGTPVASDNCSSVTIINDAPTTFPIGLTVVSWTAIDANGNRSSCVQNVFVTDTTAPVITCIGNQTIYLDADCGATVPDYTNQIITSDNCGFVNLSQFPAAGTLLSGVGNLTITMLARDGNGNMSSCDFTLNKLDTIAPVISCPGTQSLDLDASCSIAIPDYTLMTNIILNNCGGLNLTQSPAAGTLLSSVGTTTVTITAQDNSGNSTICTFDVNTQDVTAPVLTCNADIVQNVPCTPVTINLSNPIATDACSGTVTITRDYTGNSFDVGTTAVTWTATDASGNSSTCVQLVTVNSQEIGIYSNNSVIVDGARKTSRSNNTNFGRVYVCSTGVTKTYEIRNLGTAPLNLTGNPVVLVTGSASNDFIVTQPSATTVAPGATITFQITFAPTTQGGRNARVWIFNDDCDESQYNFKVRGQGRRCSAVSSLEVDTNPQFEWFEEDELESNEILEVSVNQNDKEFEGKLYPNPNLGVFVIELNHLPKGDIQMRLINDIGQIVRIDNIKNKQTSFDYRDIEPGVYYIQITSDTGNLIIPMIISER